MYDIGDFIEFLEENSSYTYILPSKGVRPQFPYVTIVPIVANIDDFYRSVKFKSAVSTTDQVILEAIESVRRSQFSITAIGDYDTEQARTISLEINSLIKKQITRDFFAGRAEAIRIISPITPRFLVQSDFNESRFGFDIQINDKVVVTQDKEYIDTLTIEDTQGKVGDIIIDD